MSTFSNMIFTGIPFIAFAANVFLFCTLLSAKKDSAVRSFMYLLAAFMIWTGGSFFMRMQFAPGVVYWWKISLTGIFLVPYMYFLLVSAYMGRKGKFLKIVWGVVTGALVICNLQNVFMTVPQITMDGNSIVSTYTVKWPAIFAVVAALLILVSVIQTISKAVKDEDAALFTMTPLFIGVGFMILGIALNTVPSLTSIPFDTLGCAVNACLIYYAFYKRRFYAISQITSKGSTFVITTALIGLLFFQFYDELMELIKNFALDFSKPETLLIILAVAVGILIFLLLSRLNESLFVRDQMRRDFQVKDFSKAVGSTLCTEDILNYLTDIIKSEIPVNHIYLCMKTESGNYASARTVKNLDSVLNINRDHPILEYIAKKKDGFFYSDFLRNPCGKGMHEKEKLLFERLDAEYILPFIDNDSIIGIAVLSSKDKEKAYTYSEITYLESLASVASIALKNAMLYEELENEAQHDVLTGLYNRRALNQRIQKYINEKTGLLTLILFNMDDFSLYNELYGNEEGDRMLQNFSKMLIKVFGRNSVTARFSGKEFAVLLPGVSAVDAKRQAENVREMLENFMNSGEEKTRKFLTFSAGICTYPSLAGNADQLLSYANLTVFQIKQRGKNQINIYSAKDGSKQSNIAGKTQELSSTIYALTAAIDAKDHYTFNHSRCVSEYAAQLAEFAGLDDELVEITRQAGYLHDIGKIGIPDAILSKTGHLTPEEFSIMRQHVERSIEMIRHLPSLDYLIPAVVGHHERYDGTGYPRGIAGEAIPITARCLSIADSFDAMVSKRSYKNKMPVETALAEIEKNLGSQFDPKLGKLFVDLIREEKIKVIVY